MRKLAREAARLATNIEKIPDATIDSSTTITVVTALTTATQLPLPSSPVEDDREYWVTNCAPQAAQMIEEMNEYCVLDIDVAVRLTRDFWRNRYALVFTPTSRVALNSVLATACNYTDVLSENQKEAVTCLLHCINAKVDHESDLNLISAQQSMASLLKLMATSFEEYGYSRTEE